MIDRDDDDAATGLPAAARGIGHELRNLGQVLVAAVDELKAVADDPVARDAALRELLPELARASRALDAHGQRLLWLGRQITARNPRSA